jgi:hypothetical protein
MHDDQFHHVIRRWLDADAPSSAPDRILDAVDVRIGSLDQAPRALPRPAMAIAAALVLLVVAIAAAGISRIGSPDPRPSEASRPSAVQCPLSPCEFTLAAGRQYVSTSIAPSVAFGVPSDRWIVADDLAGHFRVEISADQRRAVAIFVDPQPTDADGQPDPDAPAGDARALADWLTERDQLVVSTPRQTVLGGLTGVVMEVRGDPDATTNAGGCLHEGFCAAVFRYAGVGAERRLFGTSSVDAIRLYLLDAGDSVVAVSVESRHLAPAAFLDTEALDVLGTLRFDSR